jgi:hypothetical protein
VWVSRYRLAVLFDAALDYAMRHREHPVYQIRETFVFDIALGDLGGWFWALRHGRISVPCPRNKVNPSFLRQWPP